MISVETLVSVLDDFTKKVRQSRHTGDYRWIRTYKFNPKIFKINRDGWGLCFTQEAGDILFRSPKKGRIDKTPKLCRSYTYLRAINEIENEAQTMHKIKTSKVLKDNPEWAAIRGHEIDDYLLNGCTKYQRGMTLKFLKPPTLDTPWIKNLISLQMLGSAATWDEIKGMSGEPIGARRRPSTFDSSRRLH